MPAAVELLADTLALVRPALATGTGRLLVGIAGPPAAGKSTLARAVADALVEQDGVPAVAVGMDGFHLANAELARLGLSDRKGAPETFDAYGFVHLLRRLRAADEPVYAPTYSRVVHESIGSALPVPVDTRVVVVEGNYLLLRAQPWARVRELLDLAVYVAVPQHVRRGPLLKRQRARGLDDAAARDWVSRSDEANARLIEQTRQSADHVLRRG